MIYKVLENSTQKAYIVIVYLILLESLGTNGVGVFANQGSDISTRGGGSSSNLVDESATLGGGSSANLAATVGLFSAIQSGGASS